MSAHGSSSLISHLAYGHCTHCCLYWISLCLRFQGFCLWQFVVFFVFSKLCSSCTNPFSNITQNHLCYELSVTKWRLDFFICMLRLLLQAFQRLTLIVWWPVGHSSTILWECKVVLSFGHIDTKILGLFLLFDPGSRHFGMVSILPPILDNFFWVHTLNVIMRGTFDDVIAQLIQLHLVNTNCYSPI